MGGDDLTAACAIGSCGQPSRLRVSLWRRVWHNWLAIFAVCGRSGQMRTGTRRLTPQDVGRRIRTARMDRGWTNEELGRRMGANWRTVQRWQAGRLPRLPTLLRLADVLGVPHAYLLESEEAPVTMNDLRVQVNELTARVNDLTRALRTIENEVFARRAAGETGEVAKVTPLERRA
jgi:transcriptional regulator with XRE-family HTH domain